MYGPPPQGLVVGGGGRKLVSVKLPTAVEPSKNCTVPLAFGAPAGGQASMLTNSDTSPVTALALPDRVVVVVIDASARTGRTAIVRPARRKILEETRERTAKGALATKVPLVWRWPNWFNTFLSGGKTAQRDLSQRRVPLDHADTRSAKRRQTCQVLRLLQQVFIAYRTL